MRKLLDIEKHICVLILDNKDAYNTMAVFLEPLLSGFEIHTDSIHHSAKIVYRAAVSDDTVMSLPVETKHIHHGSIGKINEMVRLLAITTRLMQDLEAAGYISTYLVATSDEPKKSFGLADEKLPYVSYNLSDKKLIQSLIFYSYRRVQVYPDFVDYYKNDYCDIDEVRERKNSSIALTGLEVARKGLYFGGIVGFMSLFVTILSLWRQSANNPNENRIDTLVNSQKIVEKKLSGKN